MKLKITIVGTGYVGLVSGVCFSDLGYSVTCVDNNVAKIDGLNNGQVPIFEPGLTELVEKNVTAGRLSFTTDLATAVAESDVVFIGVGTPTNPVDGSADLKYVYAVAEDIAPALQDYTIVVNKSTVPVGTAEEVDAIIRKNNPDANFEVVSNPEFLREGAAIRDFKRPDRVVVGVKSDRAREVMRQLYSPFFVNDTPILFTDPRTSELIKYTSNAFLATKIAFINEMADLCEAVDANVKDVSLGMGLDSRIGKKFLNAGPGYGGSCFPKDTRALLDISKKNKAISDLVETVIRSNTQRKTRMADKVVDILDGDISGKTICILGLAFKPSTDDTRETPAFPIIESLQGKGATIRAYDPEAMEEAKHALSDVTYCDNPYDCAKNADALVIVTEWEAFRTLDFDSLGETMAQKKIVDLRNVYDPKTVRAHGFEYVSIGRS